MLQFLQLIHFLQEPVKTQKIQITTTTTKKRKKERSKIAQNNKTKKLTNVN